MIKVTKDFDTVPESINYSIDDLKIRNLLRDKGQKDIQGYSEPDVKIKLKAIYHNRCAYCESKDQQLQIEHYRPKKGVNEVPKPKHHGYYWLALEWSNLLLACGGCNAQDAKGNKFPIENEIDRIITYPIDKKDWRIDSSILECEKPLLLNPEIDTPEEHIVVRYDGFLIGTTIRGEKTIDVCKLNRDNLWLTRRQNKIDEVFRYLKKQTKSLLKDLQKDKIKLESIADIEPYFERTYFNYFTEIYQKLSPETEYSRVYQCIVKYFKTFLEHNTESKNLLASEKRIILHAFQLTTK